MLKKTFFLLTLFFIIENFSPVYASNDYLINKFNDFQIKQRVDDKMIKFTNKEEEIKKIKSSNKIKKQSFEELQNEKIIPDVIIMIDSEKVNEEEFNKILDKLKNIKNEGKKIDFFSSNNLKGIYIYLYNSKNILNELREEFSSDAIKISSNIKLNHQYIPNDSYYYSQWNLHNINWSTAMDLGIGSNSVTIGIIDNGVDTDDLDLSSNIWQNPNEVYGDLTDNDGNGYLDDKYGCNFYMKINQGLNYIPCEKEYIKEDLTFDSKHGTHVTQIAAGVTNNSLGIAGVCSNCKVAVLKITDDFGNGDLSLLPYVFNYAINKGFKILNLSMASVCPFDSFQDIYALDINNLINNYGIMLVQAAGNNGSMTQNECISFCGTSNTYCYSSARNQAYYYVIGKNVSNKINVASINSNNQRSSWSNYDGSNTVITVAAPGENIPVFPYNLISGTSFSAPIVSGALGVYLSLNFPMSITSSKIYNDLISISSYLPDQSISRKKLDLFALISQTKAINLDYNTNYLPISRFWSDMYNGHLYSTGEEAKSVIRDYSSNIWKYEGIVYHAFRTNVVDTLPVYRFWSDTYRSHFYTQSEDEKNYVINHYPTNIWRYEGVVFYAYTPNKTGKLNIYRFWSDVYKKHFYAAGESERDYVINSLSNVWRYEQPAWSVDLR
jgi:subtilisin family serine protease